MSQKHLFFTLPAISLMLSGFAPVLAEEPSSSGVSWIWVLIVLILLIPLVWWLMRSSGVKATEHRHASTDTHAPIQSSLPLETEAIDLAPVAPAPVKAEVVADEAKEVIQNVVDQIGEAAEGEAEVGAIAPTPEEAKPALVAAAAESQPTRRAQAIGKPDDLVIIEGIGPKISHILQENGIRTFAELAAADINQIEEILSKAGLSNITDPLTWAEQAQLAADGKWDELKTLQNALKGGRRA